MDKKFEMTNSNIAALDANLVAVSSSVGELSNQVKTNASDILVLKESVDAIRKKSATEIQREVRSAIAKEVGKSTLSPVINKTGSQDSQYWRARRSVRIWPITATDNDLWTTVGLFFNRTLEIPDDALPESVVEDIRRIANKKRLRPTGNRPPRVHSEVLVTFYEVATRDMVMSYAPNLAKTNNTAQTSGIRMEIPPNLRGIFKTLDDHGHLLRLRHGTGVKRNIKFDDGEMSLYMDLKLPSEPEWMRVDPEIAREELKHVKNQESQNTRRRISSLSAADSSPIPSPTERLATSSSSLPESSILATYGRPWGSQKK